MADTRITDKAAARAFILGGNATFTLVSQKTGLRFTFRVRVSRKSTDPIHHVEVLAAHAAYEYVGSMLPRRAFNRSGKSKLSATDQRVLAFGWFWRTLVDPEHTSKLVPETVEMWHIGKCARCARPLTDPISIQSGFGPECHSKMAAYA